jgi:hypothetical protein
MAAYPVLLLTVTTMRHRSVFVVLVSITATTLILFYSDHQATGTLRHKLKTTFGTVLSHYKALYQTFLPTPNQYADKYWTDKPRNQSTVNINAVNWLDILPYRAKLTPSDAVWMPVLGAANASQKFGYVYSSFLDSRTQLAEPAVRVLGALLKDTSQVFCRFHYDGVDDDSSMLYAASVEPQWTPGKGPFLAVFIICPLRDLATMPASVSIHADQKTAPSHQETNNLFIHGQTNPAAVKTQSTLGFCVRHLWNTYKDVVQMIEFLEMHAVLGATVFHLYGHSYSKQVCLLQYQS